MAPGVHITAGLKAATANRHRDALRAALARRLPQRFADRWVELHLRTAPDWTNAGLDRTEAALHQWRVQPNGTEGFAKAEVTAGGVDTASWTAEPWKACVCPASTSWARWWM